MASTSTSLRIRRSAPDDLQIYAERSEELAKSLPLIFGRDSEHRVVVVCSEPGMGAGRFVRRYLSAAEGQGIPCVSRDLSAADAERATKTIVRLTSPNSKAMNNCLGLVCIEHVPPCDEAQVARQARVIGELSRHARLVVVTMAPEARQLAEALPDAVAITSHDLLLTDCADAEADRGARYRATRGIPALEDSLAAVGADFGEGTALPRAYCDVYLGLVARALREGLSEEELSLRLAMLLLGSGSTAALEGLPHGCSRELVGDLWTFAPLFGISGDLRSFECVSADDLTALAFAREPLAAACARVPHALFVALEQARAVGDAARMAFLASLLDATEVDAFVLRHASVFVNRAEWDLLRRAVLDASAHRLLPRGRVGLVEAACGARLGLGGQGHRLLAATESGDLDEEATTLRLLARARRALGKMPDDALAMEPRSALGELLQAHCRVAALMKAGNFADALCLVEAQDDLSRAEGLARWLLEADALTCEVLLGERTCAQEVAARSAQVRESLEPQGLSSLGSVPLVVVETLCGALLGRDHLNQLAGECETARNLWGECLAVLVVALQECASGDLAPAAAHASQLGRLAARCESSLMLDVSELLWCALRAADGEKLDGTRAWLSEGVGALGAGVVAALGNGRLEGLAPRPPQGTEWLLALLVRSLEACDVRFVSGMPSAWRACAAELAGRWGPGLAAAAVPGASPEKGDPVASPAPAQRVRINLLGGFEMRLNDVPVSDALLERRRAKAVVEYLALRHRFQATRYDIISQVWPEDKFPAAQSKLCQATRVVRTSLKEMGLEATLVTVSRTEKTVGLNPDIVECDVSLFRAHARAAIERVDAVRTINEARLAEELYAGDLFRPFVDGTGFISSTREELRDLYVDAMVAGSEMALAIGRDELAARFARNATLADELREDAMVCMLRALASSGRMAEANRIYRQYSKSVVRKTGRPPAASIRAIVEGSGAKAGAPRIEEATVTPADIEFAERARAERRPVERVNVERERPGAPARVEPERGLPEVVQA